MRAVFVIFVFVINLYACALCSLYSPTAHISSKFDIKDDTIKSIKFTWSFSENFSNLMLQTYDINSNKKFEKDELDKITTGLLDYLVPNDFLTNISYYKKGENAKELILKIKDYDMVFNNGRLKFEIEIFLNLKVELGLVISAEIVDKSEYFYFTFMDKKAYEIAPRLYLMQNTNANVNFYEIVDEKTANQHNEIPRLDDLVSLDKAYDEIDKIDAAKFDSISQISIGFLDRLKQMIRQNKEQPSFASMLFILSFSFIYGFLHAAGPGHAKLLTSSYFSAVGGSYVNALLFALKVGFLHVLGAFLLVSITLLTLSEIGSLMGGELTKISTIFCGIVIIFISSYMIFNSLKAKRKIYKWNTHSAGCNCISCKSLKVSKNSLKEWLLAGSLAIIPCPGVILVFMLAFELGSYAMGMISGVFIALGMSVVIFLAGVLGQKINQKWLSKFKNYQSIVQIFGLFVMFVLGVFMIYISFESSIF